jgi:hypothetical protein
MFKKYKEIFYGLLFGLGAWAIDAGMHARMENVSFWTALFQPQAGMIFYRVLVIFFGLALGWSLWQKNKREREFRQLAETLVRFHLEIVQPAFLIHADAEVLLAGEEMHLSPAALAIVRSVYDKAQSIVSLAKERLPAVTPN